MKFFLIILLFFSSNVLSNNVDQVEPDSEDLILMIDNGLFTPVLDLNKELKLKLQKDLEDAFDNFIEINKNSVVDEDPLNPYWRGIAWYHSALPFDYSDSSRILYSLFMVEKARKDNLPPKEVNRLLISYYITYLNNIIDNYVSSIKEHNIEFLRSNRELFIDNLFLWLEQINIDDSIKFDFIHNIYSIISPYCSPEEEKKFILLGERYFFKMYENVDDQFLKNQYLFFTNNWNKFQESSIAKIESFLNQLKESNPQLKNVSQYSSIMRRIQILLNDNKPKEALVIIDQFTPDLLLYAIGDITKEAKKEEYDRWEIIVLAIQDTLKIRAYKMMNDIDNLKKTSYKIDGYFDKFLNHLEKMTDSNNDASAGVYFTIHAEIFALLPEMFSYSEYIGDSKILLGRYEKAVNIIEKFNKRDYLVVVADFKRKIASLSQGLGDVDYAYEILQESVELNKKAGIKDWYQANENIKFALLKGDIWYINNTFNDLVEACIYEISNIMTRQSRGELGDQSGFSYCNELYKLQRSEIHKYTIKMLRKKGIDDNEIYVNFHNQEYLNKTFIYDSINCRESLGKDNLGNDNWLSEQRFVKKECATTQLSKEDLYNLEKFYYRTLSTRSLFLEFLFLHVNQKDPKARLSAFKSAINPILNHRPEETKLAGIYAKLFLKELVQFRKYLSTIEEDGAEVYTESIRIYLQDILNIFYDLGDTDWAMVVLKLLKQQEYLDFVRRNSEITINLPELNDYEYDYEKKLEVFIDDLIQLSKNFDSNYEEYNRLAEDKYTQLLNLENSVRTVKKEEVKNNIYLVNSKKIKQSEILVQYNVSKDNVDAYLQTYTTPLKKISLNIEPEKMRVDILNLVNSIEKKSFIDEKLLKKISDYLIKPIGNEIKGFKTIKFINDDLINLLPMEILVFNKQSLMEKFNVVDFVHVDHEQSYISEDLKIFYAARGSKGKYNFVPLPNVEYEAKEIKKIVESKYKKISLVPNNEFNKDSFFSSLGSKNNNIHIATHVKSSGGKYDEIIMLMGDGNVVSMEDIHNAVESIPIQNVVLSACDTADLIPSNKSKSFVGFSSFFHYKGSENVISTLWSIGDKATSEFMIIFYDLLSSNKITIQQALHETKRIFRNIEYLNNLRLKTSLSKNKIKEKVKNFSHPYYWAAFQLSTTN